MPDQPLQGFAAKPDLGATKTAASEYLGLQNIRGRGYYGFKRQGVQYKASFTSGVMGIFDLAIDGDPLSLDKIMVISRGRLTFFVWSEFVNTFNYLFAAGTKLNLQAPNLQWYSVAPVSASNPAWEILPISAPVITLSVNLVVSANQLYGFADSTGAWRMFTSIIPGTDVATIESTRFNPPSALTTYSSAQSYNTGFGPVFQDNTTSPQNWLLSVTNAPALSLTPI